MIDFTGVSAIRIPEGSVAKITNAQGVILWEKPSEGDYTFPEYLMFNADMVFDTGICCTQNTTIEVRFTNEASDARYLYGARTTNNTASVTAYLTSSGAWRFGNTYRNLTTKKSTDIHNVVVSKSGVEFDDNSYKYGATVKTFTCPWTLTVGSARTTSGAKTAAQFIGKLYHFRMYDGDTLVLDWIPCVKADGTHGLYDQVTGTFISPM
jgi:hypothetical protein